MKVDHRGGSIEAASSAIVVALLALLVAPACGSGAAEPGVVTPAAFSGCLMEEGVIPAPTGGFAPPLEDIGEGRAFAVSFASLSGEIAIDRATAVVAATHDEAQDLERRFRRAGGPLNELPDDIWDATSDVFGSVFVLWDAQPTARARSIVERCATEPRGGAPNVTTTRPYT